MFLWLLFLVLLIVAVVWFFRRPDRGGGAVGRRPPALDVLEERYARGEIDRDEYLQKKRDLTPPA